jgi:D-3-phosphoglycerate dehydrogenase
MTFKIIIGPSSFSEADKSPLKRLSAGGFDVIDNRYKRKMTKEELLELLKEDVIGLIAGLEPLDREVLQKSNLKVISRVGSGMSNVDMEAAKELGIVVLNTPYGPTTAVAELTIGAMLNLIRMISLMDKNLHKGKWTKKIGTQLEGKTVVIVGYGRIGRKVAFLLFPFNVNLLVVDPFLPGMIDDIPVMTLEEALPKADIITLHSSGEDCILGEREFQLIKPGAFVLNAARGGLIDEDALISALDDGRILGAWLDTFGQEPYAGPLTRYPQVILTPHVGSYTRECRKEMEMEAVENLLKGLQGE